MTPGRHRQIKGIFDSALECDAGRRAAFLAEACAGDEGLRAEVESLISAHEAAGSFIAAPVYEQAAEMIAGGQAREMSGRRLGRYQLGALLGAGGMGEVYRARDTRLEREVAVKILPEPLAADREALGRFEREARAVAALSHPHILSIYDIGTEEGVTYAVMELLEGETLRARLARSALAWREALEIGLAVAEGLEAAHAKGIIHRDLKPENIFLTSDGGIKILDFGIARVKRAVLPDSETLGSNAPETTRPGVVMGTLGYMSPEQVRGEAAEAPSDVFAFGCVLYEMVSGRRAFARSTGAETVAAILKEEPPSLAATGKKIPAELERVTRHCLEKGAGERYQSARELTSDLRAILGGSGGSITAPTLRRRRRQGTVLTVLALVTAGLGYFAWQSRSGPGPAAAAAGILALPAKVYGAPEFAYLTDAVPGTLSTHLAQVEGLETKVPPTSFEVERVGGDIARVAELYGVRTCVVSSVTAEGDRLVLHVQLVEARGRRVLWSREYEGRRGSYLDLARQAADGIRRALKPAAPPVTAGVSLAANSEAELAFRQGQYLWNRYNNQHQPGDFDLALVSLKRALELDPQLADAAGYIATLYTFKYEAGAPLREVFPEAESWARRALEINPRCSKGWYVLAYITGNVAQQSQKVLEYGLKAVFFGPQDPMAHLALTGPLCSLELGIACDFEARRLDPLYLYPPLNAAIGLGILGRPAEGLTLVEEVLRIEPDMPMGLWMKAMMLIYLGRLDEAAELVKRLETLTAENRLLAYLLFIAEQALALERGDRKEAEASLSQILKRVNDPRTLSSELGWICHEIVPLLTRHGKTDLAFQLLNRGLEVGAIPTYDWLMLDSRLEPLRADARFKQILSRSRAQFDETLKLLEQARGRGELPPYLETAIADLLKKLGIK